MSDLEFVTTFLTTKGSEALFWVMTSLRRERPRIWNGFIYYSSNCPVSSDVRLDYYTQDRGKCHLQYVGVACKIVLEMVKDVPYFIQPGNNYVCRVMGPCDNMYIDSHIRSRISLLYMTMMLETIYNSHNILSINEDGLYSIMYWIQDLEYHIILIVNGQFTTVITYGSYQTVQKLSTSYVKNVINNVGVDDPKSCAVLEELIGKFDNEYETKVVEEIDHFRYYTGYNRDYTKEFFTDHVRPFFRFRQELPYIDKFISSI